MTKKRKLLLIISISAIVIGVAWYVAIHKAADRDYWLFCGVEQIAQVTLVFIDDKGRLPLNIDELVIEGYIQHKPDGTWYPASSIIGRRPTEYGTGIRDLPIFRLEEIIIRYNNWPERDVISVPEGSPKEAISNAHRMSVFIDEKLSAIAPKNPSTTSKPSE
ncbi:MAG: hypothetical protein HZA50_15100 [Planctomycetes bacterium]|nr:hypothetical protein [Planctomycetota bacterium]